MQSYDKQAIYTYTKHLLYPYKGKIIFNIGNVFVRSILFMVPPVMSKYILEWVLPQKNWNLLLIVSVCIFLVPILGSAMIALETYTTRFIYSLFGRGQADLYNGIQYRPLAWFQKKRIGDLLTRVLDDTRMINQWFDGTIFFMLFLLITIGIGSIVLLVLHLQLGAAMISLWLIHSIVISRLSDSVKQNAAEIKRQTSHVTETAREVLAGAQWIMMSGQEAKALDTMKDCLQQEWAFTRLGLLTDNVVKLTDVVLHACFLALMYYWGGSLVLDGAMTIGSLVSFIAVYTWLRPFGISLYGMVLSAKRTMPSVERVAEIAYPIQHRSGIEPKEGVTGVVFDKVSFHYGGNAVLHDFSLQLPAKSVLSLVGPRGGGKSTMADLLLRLQAPTSGTIYINGIPLHELDESWIRRNMLYVTQDIILRNGTLLDNITLGCPDFDPSTLKQALIGAELDSWISQLPQGIQTEVGEHGMYLSGGERQRVSIARALIRKPSLLILDEPTSALDTHTEHKLITKLIEGLPGAMLIFITHRMAVAKHFDRIYVLKEGRIEEAGRYDELAEKNEFFRELVRKT